MSEYKQPENIINCIGQEDFAKYGKTDLVVMLFWSPEDQTSLELRSELDLLAIEHPEILCLCFSVKEIKNVVFAKKLRITRTPLVYFMKNGSPKTALFGKQTKDSIYNTAKKYISHIKN